MENELAARKALRLQRQEKKLARIARLKAKQARLYEQVLYELEDAGHTPELGEETPVGKLMALDALVCNAEASYKQWCTSEDAKDSWYLELHGLQDA